MASRILVVAAKLGYQIRSFDQAAGRLGIDLRLASDRCHVLDDPWGDRAMAVSFDDPARSANEWIGGMKDARFDGILAVGDRPALFAAHLADALQLPFHPPAAVAAARNKFASRERFRGADMLTPEYFRVALNGSPESEAARASYPCVLKPLGLSGSRGVIRANDSAEFVGAFQRIRRLLSDPDIRRFQDPQDGLILVEEYIPGREFAVEGVMTRGEFRVLAIFDKPDPLEGPFFEETIYVTPSRESETVQQAIAASTANAARALGLYHGPVHAEMRVNDRGVWMLEAAARPIGGLCSGALRFVGDASGSVMSLEEYLLRHAAGEELSSVSREAAASGVMMIPVPEAGVYTGVVGIERAMARAGITKVVMTAKEGETLLPLPEGSGYPGFLFGRSERPEDVETALREAHACLHLCISAALPITR